MESTTTTRAAALLERKNALGKLATYEVLTALTGTSNATLHRVLNETESAVPINREAVMDKVEAALNLLELQRDVAA